MISSLLFKETYKVIDVNNSMKIGENILNIKDIPFFRYRFNQYGESEIKYIVAMQQKFPLSVHLAEVELTDSASIEAFKTLCDNEKIAVFGRIPVSSIEAKNADFSDSTKQIISEISNEMYDRIVLHDVDNELFTFSADVLKSYVANELGVVADEVGICGSSCSLGSNACLDSVRARELMTQYVEEAELSLPTSKHQDMTECGCIRHIIVTGEIHGVASKQTSIRKSSSKSEAGETKAKDNKPSAKIKSRLVW